MNAGTVTILAWATIKSLDSLAFRPFQVRLPVAPEPPRGLRRVCVGRGSIPAASTTNAPESLRFSAHDSGVRLASAPTWCVYLSSASAQHHFTFSPEPQGQSE